MLFGRLLHAFPDLLGSNQFDQFGPHPLDDARVLAARGLPEQPRGRVPGGIVAIEQPAPIGHIGQHDPDWTPKSTSQVSNAGVNRNDKIKMLKNGRGISEAVELGTEVKNVALLPKNGLIRGANFLLQTDELRLDIEKRQQRCERNRAIVIVGVPWISRPNQSNSRRFR